MDVLVIDRNAKSHNNTSDLRGIPDIGTPVNCYLLMHCTYPYPNKSWDILCCKLVRMQTEDKCVKTRKHFINMLRF